MGDVRGFYSFDRALIPYLTGQRIHPTYQVERMAIGRDPAPVIVPQYTYSPSFAAKCARDPQAQYPVDIQRYSGGYPITQVPDQRYADLWRCRMYKFMQDQGDVVPLYPK